MPCQSGNMTSREGVRECKEEGKCRHKVCRHQWAIGGGELGGNTARECELAGTACFGGELAGETSLTHS